jgi:thiol-disulfide isomerase/thioredoxin
MTFLRKRRWFWVGLALTVLLASAGFLARNQLFGLISKNAEGELGEIRAQWMRAREAHFGARAAAKSASEKQAADEEFSSTERQFVERCRVYATAHAGTTDEIRALKMLACRLPESSEGKQAFDLLVKRASSDDLGEFERGFGFPVGTSEGPVRRLAPVLFDRVKRTPDDPAAAHVLASAVCRLTAEGNPSRNPPSDFKSAADLIVEHYAESPDIQNFCEIVGVGHLPWAGAFEKHLRTILERNRDRKVRVAASFALANVVQGAGESRQLEAQELYQAFVDQFDGSVHYIDDGKWYAYAGVEKDYNRAARQQLVELSARGLGKPAPEIIGVDLDDGPLKLSDFRGKVVLLSFWATSCGPCLKFVPDERALLERFEVKSFTIVGVNCDEDSQVAKKTAGERGIAWRSFRNDLGQGRAITTDWQNTALPMLYLIDRRGILRRRWVGVPLHQDLSDAVAQLCAAAP